MKSETLKLLNDVNSAIIKFRGIYSAWSYEHGISYNEMLVLYTIREHGYCTQKQICDSYLLPRQTMNHVFTVMRNQGILQYSNEKSVGKEKAYVLSEQGKEYATPFIESLDTVELRAIELLGEDTLEHLTELLLQYDGALTKALEEKRQK
ncbi:MAG: winged helix-turn-helix transcriptional regulator [Lachnospiraceae bacterium]|nr:winged helix-turn-helix transcriptional regulator [Lachnospiraceae bacterium]